MTPYFSLFRRRRQPPADEFITNRPARVARREIVWDEQLDIRIIEANDAELTQIAIEIGASFSRLKRRQDALFGQVFKEMAEERL